MSQAQKNIALISMPWALFNRPSIQLGTLKSYLEKNSDIIVHCLHPYLGVAKDIGVEKYQFLSKNGWAGDALYSALLFSEKKSDAQILFRECCKREKELAAQFESVLATVAESLERWLAVTDFSTYKLIGFSVCFNQLFSSLLAAEKIKQKYPKIKIVFGGSSCAGDMGTSLHRRFAQVDHVIAGEGEQQLLDLCNSIFAKAGNKSDLASKKNQNVSPDCHPLQLDSLPTPDFQHYFTELQHHFPGLPFSPRLPLEFSRGCWWRKCKFCNLNLQWQGYRSKSAKKVAHEVRKLHSQHNNLDFTFCDNALPEKEADTFFKIMGDLDIDFDFFAEIRPLRDPERLRRYHRGGLTKVQVGIESLSISLLNKMAKGTTVIENLAIMKHCAERNIALDGNLIVEFPGSTPEEVAETMANLDFALPYNPLQTATFFLGVGSPVAQSPADYGIRSITQHRNVYKLFPKTVLKDMNLLIKDYRGDRTEQRKLWRPVRRKIKQWQDFHNHRNNAVSPPLSYRDGGSFLVIRQERPDGPPLLHRLHGTSRKLYLSCMNIQSVKDIVEQFNSLQEKTILNFFDDLSKKHLLYLENNKCLALALRVHL